MKRTKLLLALFTAGTLHFTANAQWATTVPTYAAPPVTTEYTNGTVQIGVQNASSTVTTPTTKLLLQEDNPVIELSDVTNAAATVGVKLTGPYETYQMATSFNTAIGPQLHLQNSGGCGYHITTQGLYIGTGGSGSCPMPGTFINTSYLNVTGPSNFANTLTAAGATTLSSTLTTTGAAKFSSTATILGNSKFSGTSNIFDNSVVIGDYTLTTPGAYKLYVAGGILTEKVKVAIKTSGAWADYVFNKDYKLLSLGEVEAYVTKNKHLPGVPSAEEVVKDGVDVATMNAKLLEKIEELTLYVIDMKKEIDVLKKENTEITKQLLK